MFIFQNFKNLFLIFFLFGVLFLSCKDSYSENEPDNNQRKNAQLIIADKPFQGTFYSIQKPDIDYLYIKVSEDKMIKGKLSGVKGINSSILFFRKGEEKAFKIIDENGSSLAEEFGPILIQSPGIVIALKSAHIASNNQYKKRFYQFTVQLISPMSPMEQEENDSIESANLIPSLNSSEDSLNKKTIFGYYNNSFSSSHLPEKDYFFIEFKEDMKYKMNINLSSVDGMDPIIRLYSENKEKLLTIDDKGISQGEVYLNFGVEGPRKIFLSINDKNRKINKNDYYELSVETEEYKFNNELEPNDTISKASIIKEETTYGLLNDRHDVDYYVIHNESNQTMQNFIEVVPSDNLDIKLELYNSNQKKITTINNGKKEENEGISNFAIKPSSKNYIKITSLNWSQTNEKNYSIHFKASSITSTDEIEPNNKIQNANILKINEEKIGYINPNEDLDYYSLKNFDKENYKVSVEGIDDCKLKIGITDSNGLVFKNKEATSYGGGISFTEKLDPTNYLVVKCKKTKKNLYKTPYTLIVRSID